MRIIPQNILTEQSKTYSIPAHKVEIDTYDFPTESSYIRYSPYDWNLLHTCDKGGSNACCAYDGSFVIFDGTTTYRFASPSLTTDFSTWDAVTDIGTFNAGISYGIAASPADGSVTLVYLSGGNLYEKISTNNGTSFGSAASVATATGYTTCKIAYDSTGLKRVIVMAKIRKTMPTGGRYLWDYRFYLDIYLLKSVYSGGAWSAWTAYSHTTELDMLMFSLRYYVSMIDYPFGSPETVGGYVYYDITLENIDIAYDGDWFIVYAASQELPGSKGGRGYPVTLGYIKYGNYYKIFGDGGEVSMNSWNDGGEISTRDTKTVINSIGDLSSFSTEYYTAKQVEYIGQIRPVIFHNEELIRTSTLHPCIVVHKIANYPLTLSLFSDGKCYFCTLMEGGNLIDAVFDKAFTLENAQPLKLASNSTHVIGYNGNQFFLSPLPTDWSYPIVGTGAGGAALEITTARIRNIKESVNANATSTLEITFDNSDDYFDALTGAKAVIANKSKLTLYKGFNISSTDTTMASQIYFIDDIGYSREPNLAEFVIKCIDAWGLLNKYVFPKKARFNYPGASTTYNIYEIIEVLVRCIGGSISFINRSSSITTLYPSLEINPGDNTANVLRRLLNLIPDIIRFYGNDAIILYPQSTDNPIYSYSFPSS